MDRVTKNLRKTENLTLPNFKTSYKAKWDTDVRQDIKIFGTK